MLAENRIVSTDNLKTYEKMAAFRDLIVHYYERIDDEFVFGIAKSLSFRSKGYKYESIK